ncbi:hypothetical protein [Streptomyces sp. NPDC057002]|uniref:hypothetical protein n=1 Tax=Streptomyces sp. NPDC057002 TaxID=3345992 RepID=UPI00362C6339
MATLHSYWRSRFDGFLETLPGAAVLTQVAFAVVAQNSKVMKGTAFHVDDSYTDGLLLFAGVVAVATLLIALIPKAKRLDEAEVGQAV